MFDYICYYILSKIILGQLWTSEQWHHSTRMKWEQSIQRNVTSKDIIFGPGDLLYGAKQRHLHVHFTTGSLEQILSSCSKVLGEGWYTVDRANSESSVSNGAEQIHTQDKRRVSGRLWCSNGDLNRVRNSPRPGSTSLLPGWQAKWSTHSPASLRVNTHRVSVTEDHSPTGSPLLGCLPHSLFTPNTRNDCLVSPLDGWLLTAGDASRAGRGPCAIRLLGWAWVSAPSPTSSSPSQRQSARRPRTLNTPKPLLRLFILSRRDKGQIEHEIAVQFYFPLAKTGW